MLRVKDRTISVLDAHGRELETLVTAFDGRTVTNAQLMPDHRTIWYATHAAETLTSCPEIVRLDLKTNERTVVAHADDFAVTPDASKLVLVFPRSDAVVANNCQPVPLPSGVSTYAAAFIERDLTTGEQWTLPVDGYHGAGTGGPHGHLYIDMAKNTLITANCVWDGCFTSTYAVPERSSDPIVFSDAGPECRCETLVVGDDGVHGVSGVEDSATQPPRTAIVRYRADRIEGSGTVIAESSDVALSSSVASMNAGVFVLGGGNLYRVENGELRL